MNNRNEKSAKDAKRTKSLSELYSSENKETPLEKALKLSSDEVIAMAIRDALAKDALREEKRKKLN